MTVSGHGAGQDEEAAHLPGLLLQRRVREYIRSGKVSRLFSNFSRHKYYSYFSSRNIFYLIFLECHFTQNKYENLFTFFRGVDGDIEYFIIF
jgi:hypothetical protein